MDKVECLAWILEPDVRTPLFRHTVEESPRDGLRSFVPNTQLNSSIRERKRSSQIHHLLLALELVSKNFFLPAEIVGVEENRAKLAALRFGSFHVSKCLEWDIYLSAVLLQIIGMGPDLVWDRLAD